MADYGASYRYPASEPRYANPDPRYATAERYTAPSDRYIEPRRSELRSDLRGDPRGEPRGDPRDLRELPHKRSRREYGIVLKAAETFFILRSATIDRHIMQSSTRYPLSLHTDIVSCTASNSRW